MTTAKTVWTEELTARVLAAYKQAREDSGDTSTVICSKLEQTFKEEGLSSAQIRGKLISLREYETDAPAAKGKGRTPKTVLVGEIAKLVGLKADDIDTLGKGNSAELQALRDAMIRSKISASVAGDDVEEDHGNDM